MLTRPVHLQCPQAMEKHFSTYDGIPQGDPMSTLVVCHGHDHGGAPGDCYVSMWMSMGVSYIDDTVLVGSPEDVSSVLQELPRLLAELWLYNSNLPKPRFGAPRQALWLLTRISGNVKATMSDIRGLTISR